MKSNIIGPKKLSQHKGIYRDIAVKYMYADMYVIYILDINIRY